jgi:hypothetical protein
VTLRQFLLLIAALVFGLLIGWLDTRPQWDDTGITVVAVLLVSLLLGAATPSRPWFHGLVFGVTLAMIELGAGSIPGTVVTLLLALAGSLLGGVVRRALIRPNRS